MSQGRRQPRPRLHQLWQLRLGHALCVPTDDARLLGESLSAGNLVALVQTPLEYGAHVATAKHRITDMASICLIMIVLIASISVLLNSIANRNRKLNLRAQEWKIREQFNNYCVLSLWKRVVKEEKMLQTPCLSTRFVLVATCAVSRCDFVARQRRSMTSVSENQSATLLVIWNVTDEYER